MQLVNFLKPEVMTDTNYTSAVDNQSFPYTAISSPRRFEELLYSIYKLKIERREISNYDEISLMSGIAEQGRDCVLFKKGKAHAVIQCKKYTNNLNKEDFGKEITKLVMYSLLDDRIIYDRNDFTYYIAVAKDFTADCRSLIDDFNNQILEEHNLAMWISVNLKLPTLQALALKDCETEVRDILSKIKVSKIVPQDLDYELLDKPELQQLFFSVRTVTDNSGVEKIRSILNGDLPEEEISKQLYNGSISLSSERNTFEGIEDSHIQRNETTQLLDWIQNTKRDNKNKIQNICLLVAPAGFGKTVILKDFYSECRLQNIPVLGLKTDKLYSYTINELQNSIGITLPVFDFIERCKALYPLTVIVIDQIDALSQSMSSDRRFLDVFKGFIDRFENDANIKIIISVRNQDLNYDPTLRQIRKNNTIQVALLSHEQVLEQLKKIGILKNSISAKLLELLRIPNNLNIFSIVSSNEKSLNVTTLQELYTELWNQKVLQIPNRVKTDKNRVRNVLYIIVEKMFNSQRITISALQLEEFLDEINYLESEQLIKREDKQIQFFHQSFYDFVFAKQFVEKELDLIAYIKDGEQSIHIRSAIKMIIAYIRDYDSILYEQYVNKIISDNEIFFHIKHIVFLNIISQSNPTSAEEELTKFCFSISWNYSVLFFEHAIGPRWIKFALDNSLLQMLDGEFSKINIPRNGVADENFENTILNLKIHFLQKHIVLNDLEAWNYFKKVENVKTIQDILYSVTDWSNKDAFEMLAKCPDFAKSQSWSYYHVLDNILKYDIDFVLNILKNTLPQNFKKGNRKNDYDERRVLDSLVKLAPDRLFPVLFESMKLGKRQDDKIDGIYMDWHYKNTNLKDNEQYDGREFLYQKLAYCLKIVASNYTADFLKFFSKYKSSNHYAVLRLLLFSLRGSEQKYSREIIELFFHFKDLGLLTHRDDLEYELRSVVEKGFAFMNADQKRLIINVIHNYQDQNELRIWSDNNNKKRIHFRWGISKYFWILRLPNANIEKDPELKRSFLELQRKFSEEKDLPMKRNLLAGAVHSPISVDAHQFMRKKHWLQSFKKYNSERGRSFDDLRGGIYELSSAFRSVVEKDPSQEKLEIINDVIESSDISIDYAISGIYGWTQSGKDLNLILPAFLKILKKDTSHNDTYMGSISGRLVSLETTAPELIHYLITTSLEFVIPNNLQFEEEDEKTSINKLITKAINTRHSAAAQYLTYVVDSSFKNIVFDAIENLLDIGPQESKAAIYFKFYYLTRLDVEKAHQLFVSALNKETDIQVIASAICSLPYFRSKGLKILDAPLRLLIESGKIGIEDSDILFTILYISYLHNQDGAKELLEVLINSDCCSRSKALGDIIKYYYDVDNSKDKNDRLLEYIISKVDEEQFDEFSWNFYNAEHMKLQDIYGFLKKYIKSKYFKLNDHFIKYLLNQCSKFPFLAVELFEYAMLNDKLELDERHSYDVDNNATKFIVSAYENVNGLDESSKAYRKKLLQSFDKLITDLRFRRNQEKILSDLI